MIDTLAQCRDMEWNIKKAEQELLRTVRMTSYATEKRPVIQQLQRLDKMMGRELVVLISGSYESGKNSLINAFIGEELLPCELSKTGPIYELHYGKEKKVIAYPGKNAQRANDTPVYITPTADGIRTITCKLKPQDNELVSVYRKIVIYWPLDILKCGIVLVEIPGLILDCGNDVVKEYIPLTDAVLYAVNGRKLYSKGDIEELREFNNFGINNIITVITCCDIPAEFESEQEKIKFEQYVIQKAETYSVLGKDAVHFVSSHREIRSSLKTGEKPMSSTGFPELRSYLNRMLACRHMIPHLNNCVKTLAECIDVMKSDPVMEKCIEPDVLRQICTIKRELSLPAEEVIPHAFEVLDWVIPSLKQDLAKKYAWQKQELYEKYQNPELHLAVIGNFSCGKSTFLNALLKQNLLSMDNLPTTALPTYVRWNKDGGPLEITVEDVRGERYVLNEETSMKRFKMETGIVLPKAPGAAIDFLTTSSSLIGKLRHVELSFPKEEKYENFCLIDTPGVNPGQEDARDHILETQSILRKKADAAIVLFPALQVYTADFQKFLDENASHLMDDSIFIVTKMDMVRRTAEQEKLLIYIKKLLQKNFNLENPAVYGISAGIALECYTGESEAPEEFQWVVGFETVMERISGKLQARRQEIIFNRVGDMVRELIHVVQDEVKQDTERLEKERGELIQYSLESLGKAYSKLYEEYAADMDYEKKKCETKIREIVWDKMSDAVQEVRRKIDRTDSPSQLKGYLKHEMEADLTVFNDKIAKEVSKVVSKQINERNSRFVNEVKKCLVEYQWYAGNAGAFAEQKKGRQMNSISLSDHLPPGAPDLVSFFLKHIEISTGGAIFLGGFIIQLLPVLMAGLVINRMLFPIRKERVKEKTLRELNTFTDKLVKEYLNNLNGQIDQVLTGAGTLLKRYQEEYKAFFDERWEEFKKRGEVLGEKIKRNKLNLSDMELIETMISGR